MNALMLALMGKHTKVLRNENFLDMWNETWSTEPSNPRKYRRPAMSILVGMRILKEEYGNLKYKTINNVKKYTKQKVFKI